MAVEFFIEAVLIYLGKTMKQLFTNPNLLYLNIYACQRFNIYKHDICVPQHGIVTFGRTK